MMCPLSSLSLSETMVARHPQFLTSDPLTIKQKLQSLSHMLPNSDIKKLVSTCPPLLEYSSTTIQHKIDSLWQLFPKLTKDKLIKMIIQQPTLLTFNIETTIQPRVERFRQMFGDSMPLHLFPQLLTYAPDTIDQKIHQVTEIKRIKYFALHGEKCSVSVYLICFV